MSRFLMGNGELRQRFGDVSRQRIFQLCSRADWPPAYDELVMGKVWRIVDVEAWIAAHRPDLRR